jgi:hypothetical protein
MLLTIIYGLKRCAAYFIYSDDGNRSVECEVEKASISLGEDAALNRESANTGSQPRKIWPDITSVRPNTFFLRQSSRI